MAKHGRSGHRGEAVWGVYPDYAKHGVGTKLLNAILAEARKKGFKRVEAEFAVANRASVRLATKCGFLVEGRRNADLILDNGTFADSYLFGKLLL